MALCLALGFSVTSTRAAPPAAPPPCPERGPRPEGCTTIEIVVAGTRTKESAERASVRTDVVTREEAERRGARSVAEALAYEASLEVNPESNARLGRPSGVQMQGLDAEHVLVLEDGEPVLGDSGGVVDLAGLPLSDVERIEYVGGPSSALYGTRALGGVVNVVTGPPRYFGPSARGRLEARSTGELFADAAGAYRASHEWLTLDASFDRRPGVELGEGRPDLLVPEQGTRSLGLRAGARLLRGLETRIKARWLHHGEDGISSQDVPGLGRYVTDLPSSTDRFVLRANESLDVGRHSRLEFSLGRSWFRNTERADLRDSPIDEERRRRLDAQSLEGVLTVAERDRTWVLGVRSEAERLSQELERDLVGGQTERLNEIEPTLLASGAMFVELGWDLWPELTLLSGARAELHSRYGGIVAPRWALAARPHENWTLRVAVGRGFRAPSAKEYGFSFDHSAIGYRVLGNPDLEPERSWGVSSDVTYRSTDRFRARLGAFGNWLDDLIITDLASRARAAASPDPAGQQNGAGVTDYTYFNVSRARTAGADLSLRATPIELLSLGAGYAFLWTRDDASGDPLPNRPRHTVTLSARVEPWSILNVEGRMRWVSAAFGGRLEDPPGSASLTRVETPAFALLDARLGVRAAKHLEAYAGVLNLLDVAKDRDRLGDTRPVLGRTYLVGLRGEVFAEEDFE